MQVTSATAVTSAAPTQGYQPDQADVDLFESLFHNDVAEPKQLAAAENTNLGDAVMAGIQRLSEGRHERVERVKNLVEADGDKPINFQDGIRLQWELMQLGLHQEITTKTADKTSQGIQTLFRNQ